MRAASGIAIALAAAALASLGGTLNLASAGPGRSLDERLRLELNKLDFEARACRVTCTVTNLTSEAVRFGKIGFLRGGELRLWRVDSSDVFVPNSEYYPPMLPNPLPMISIAAGERAQVEVIIPLGKGRSKSGVRTGNSESPDRCRLAATRSTRRRISRRHSRTARSSRESSRAGTSSGSGNNRPDSTPFRKWLSDA